MIKFEYSCEDELKNSISEKSCFDLGPNFDDMNEHWRGIEIEYRYNSMGFRGAEPEQGKPCYVSFGDSNTVGVGLHLHQAYPELIAKHFDVAHYSFAKQGIDAASVFRNIHLFFKNNMHSLDVKFMTVLWPVWDRFTWVEHGHYQPLMKENYRNPQQRQFMDYWEQEVSLNYTVHFAHTIDLLCKLHNIPLVQTTWMRIPEQPVYEWPDSFFNPAGEGVYNERLGAMPVMIHDQARDKMHGGPESNKLTANFYIRHLTDALHRSI
jgi:hypothetical protein